MQCAMMKATKLLNTNIGIKMHVNVFMNYWSILQVGNERLNLYCARSKYLFETTRLTAMFDLYWLFVSFELCDARFVCA